MYNGRQILVEHVLGVGEQQISRMVSLADQYVGYGPAVEPLDYDVQRAVFIELGATCDFCKPLQRVDHILQGPSAVQPAEELPVAVESQHYGIVLGTDIDCDSLGIYGAIMEKIPEVGVARRYLDEGNEGAPQILPGSQMREEVLSFCRRHNL